MEQLERIKAQITNLHELRDLIRAMRAMAASHVQEAQAALGGIRRYVGVIEDAIGEAATLLPHRPEDWTRSAAASGHGLIVVCSEHGFTGGYNEALLDKAQEVLTPGRQLGVVGRRGALLAEERRLDIAWTAPIATHVGGIAETTRLVVDRLAETGRADIVFARYRRGGDYTIALKNILPLDPALLTGSDRRIKPIHNLPVGILLEKLAYEYLFGEISLAIMEALASENGARLRAMEAADINIADKLDTLGRRENALRQEAITEELLDVVTGAEAILHRA